MHSNTGCPAGRGAVFVLALVAAMVPGLLAAQSGSAALSGVVRDGSGKAIAGATVAAESTVSGQAAKTETDAKGDYSLAGLTPGSYSVRVTADGFASKEAKAAVTASGEQTLNFSLAAATKEEELPNAPGAEQAGQTGQAGQAGPSLESLGFTPQQMQSNPQLQARLNRRTEMLKIHQRLGLITVAPLVADLITGPMAKAKGKNGQPITEPTQTNLDLHAALGSTTAALYFTSAYYAIFAPKIPGTHKHGAIRVHEALMWVHLPGMILTPILGAMAFQQEQNGEKVHGIASAHGAVAYTTAIAYGTAIIAVAWPIHLKFWEKK